MAAKSGTQGQIRPRHTSGRYGDRWELHWSPRCRQLRGDRDTSRWQCQKVKRWLVTLHRLFWKTDPMPLGVNWIARARPVRACCRQTMHPKRTAPHPVAGEAPLLEQRTRATDGMLCHSWIGSSRLVLNICICSHLLFGSLQHETGKLRWLSRFAN